MDRLTPKTLKEPLNLPKVVLKRPETYFHAINFHFPLKQGLELQNKFFLFVFWDMTPCHQVKANGGLTGIVASVFSVDG
jgi:hypothetical protein